MAEKTNTEIVMQRYGERGNGLLTFANDVLGQWKLIPEKDGKRPPVRGVAERYVESRGAKWWNNRGTGDRDGTIRALVDLATARLADEQKGVEVVWGRDGEEGGEEVSLFADVEVVTTGVVKTGEGTKPKIVFGKERVIPEQVETAGQGVRIQFAKEYRKEKTVAESEQYLAEKATQYGADWNDMAYVQFDGVPITQVNIEGRYTCVLAVLQMLMTHANWIDINTDLVHLKGDMIDMAEGLAVVADQWGTLNLHDRDQLLEYLDSIRQAFGVDEHQGDLEIVDGAYLTQRAEDEEYSPQVLLLEEIVKDFVTGKNAVWGVTQIAGREDRQDALAGGHQVVINGVATITRNEKQHIYFHIIDPLGGERWTEFKSLVDRIAPRGFRAESKKPASTPQPFRRDK